MAHEYCYFLHDECVRALVEYEKAKVHIVTVKFKSGVSAKEFQKLAQDDPTAALFKTGHPKAARRVMLNTITMAMVSDCMHHAFEALKCFEKRKIVVAFNLLRKPLKQNLLYLAWIFGDEDAFYKDFMTGNPENLSQKKIGNIRKEIFAKAIAKMPPGSPFDPDILESIIYARKYEQGFEMLFEHAVHLITVERLELRTSPQNFNFIFKNYADDDTYENVYRWLPYCLFFLSHCVIGLFNRMKKMPKGAHTAFAVRSLTGFSLVASDDPDTTLELLEQMLPGVACPHCKTPLKMTIHNASRIVMTESYRCSCCGRKNPLPFSWIF